MKTLILGAILSVSSMALSFSVTDAVQITRFDQRGAKKYYGYTQMGDAVVYLDCSRSGYPSITLYGTGDYGTEFSLRNELSGCDNVIKKLSQASRNTPIEIEYSESAIKGMKRVIK